MSCERLRLFPHPGERCLMLRTPRERERIPPDLLQSLKACADGEAPWPLAITGRPGCGKTCGALYLADRCMGSYRYGTFDELTERLRRCTMGEEYVHGLSASRRMTVDSFWADIAERNLIVVDEVGARDRVTDFAYNMLKGVLDKREGRPLIVISNVTANAIAHLFDDRIASRLFCGTVCHVEGDDQRQRADSRPVELEPPETDAAYWYRMAMQPEPANPELERIMTQWRELSREQQEHIRAAVLERVPSFLRAAVACKTWEPGPATVREVQAALAALDGTQLPREEMYATC